MDSNCREMDPWNAKQAWDATVLDAVVHSATIFIIIRHQEVQGTVEFKNKPTWLTYGE